MQEKNYYAAALENLRKAYRDHTPVNQSPKNAPFAFAVQLNPTDMSITVLVVFVFFISILFLRQQTNDSVDSESKELDPTSAEASSSDQWWQSDDYQEYHEQVAHEEGCHKSACPFVQMWQQLPKGE